MTQEIHPVVPVGNSDYHKSVLVREVIAYLDPQPNKIYLDVTFGGGGHTRAILEAQPACKVIALDWHEEAIEKNGPALQAEFGDRIQLLWGNFAHLTRILKKNKIKSVDGILADFGTSQHQIHKIAGFSFASESILDMRMSTSHQKIQARDILNRASEAELIHIMQEYGEEYNARKIARAIIAARAIKKINTTGDLTTIIESVIPHDRKKKIHPATKTFQALRIAVNDEMHNLNSFLLSGLEHLNPAGRLVCISFHSLEDRPVKTFIREHASQLRSLTKKPVMAQDDELAINPSARSAKLRAAEKIG